MGGIKKIDGINIGKNLEKGGQKKKPRKKPGKKLILPWWVKNEVKKANVQNSQIGLLLGHPRKKSRSPVSPPQNTNLCPKHEIDVPP